MVHIIHNIHFPVSAKSFIVPIVEYLIENNISTELWLENNPKHLAVIEDIHVPKKFVNCDLTFNPIKFIFRLKKYFSQLKAEKQLSILHTHQTRSSLIPLLAGRFARIPKRIYHNHGLPYLGYAGLMRWFLWTLEYINIILATHVLFVSQSNLDAAVADKLITSKKANILGSGSIAGIDLTHFKPEKFQAGFSESAKLSFGIPTDSFVLSYIGRPVKRKGLHLLLEAWGLTGLGNRNSFLLIAGCTQQECEEASKHSLIGVKGLGYLQDLTMFYAASDALTLPSRHEGFPYSLLEAAAAGLPLIGTNIPGISCAIKDGHTGLLVPYGKASALAEVILILAEDEKYRLMLGSNARLRVEAEFSRKLVLERLENFYREILL